MNNFFKNILIYWCVVLIFASVTPLSAKGLSGLGSMLAKEDIDATADQLDFVGDNIIAKGHVVVKYKDIWVTADKAIINLTEKSIDVSGRVTFIRRSKEDTEVDYEEYLNLLKKPDTKVILKGYVMTPTGRQKLQVTIIKEINNWTGKHASGDLTTGVFELGDFSGKNGPFYISGQRAEREAGGNINIQDAKITTCEYVKDHHEHYSLTASSIELYPNKKNQDEKYYTDKGHYHMIVWNAVLRVGDVPIFYFPFLYKPPDGGGLGIQIKGGSDSDWGYYVLTKKTMKFYAGPANMKTTLMADYYSKRGPGGGVAISANTTNSFTEGFIYGVYDKDFKDERKARFDYDSQRYDMYLSHLSHITPRLDLRAHMEMLSDPRFLHDFFESRYTRDPQPISFASLEYQFDRLSIGAYVRPRTNDFFSVVESLPELRIDIPRQELFKGLYYQGETSFAYMQMKWRDYDHPRPGNLEDPSNYYASRFDTLHMFYYPFKVLDAINIIPRAGIRMTAYSNTSDQKVTQDDLAQYFRVDSITTSPGGSVVNYDSHGGSEFRFASEFGLEMNTKIYRTWNSMKSAFWELDGVRHVMVPYINYNYIPDVSVNRDHIYYFDDIDRITEQNFIRVGVKNRLETRRGAYGHQQIYEWASLENYVDFHFKKEKDFNNMGDFGTIFKWNPFPNFSTTSDLLVDVGDGKINRFSTRFEYQITKDWKPFFGYRYRSDYKQRTVYSMGSSLTDITSGSAFMRSYNKSQTIFGGLEFPILNEKTKGEVSIYYDLNRNNLTEGRARIVRKFHCWELGVEYRLRERNDDMGDRQWEQNVMLTLSLTDLPSVKIAASQGISTGGDGGPSN